MEKCKIKKNTPPPHVILHRLGHNRDKPYPPGRLTKPYAEIREREIEKDAHI